MIVRGGFALILLRPHRHRLVQLQGAQVQPDAAQVPIPLAKVGLAHQFQPVGLGIIQVPVPGPVQEEGAPGAAGLRGDGGGVHPVVVGGRHRERFGPAAVHLIALPPVMEDRLAGQRPVLHPEVQPRAAVQPRSAGGAVHPPPDREALQRRRVPGFHRQGQLLAGPAGFPEGPQPHKHRQSPGQQGQGGAVGAVCLSLFHGCSPFFLRSAPAQRAISARCSAHTPDRAVRPASASPQTGRTHSGGTATGP